MVTVRIEGVDERDSEWEVYEPRFRVYLQGGTIFHSEGREGTGGATDTYDITGADLLQVIDWAQRQAASEESTYAIALVREDGPGGSRGLVWLVGRDGNDVYEEGEAGDDAQLRMLSRRSDPIRLPAFDVMPPAVPNLDDVS